MRYENYIFDLYGTLVDIHTDENEDVVWEKLALFYGYYDALYRPEELKERFRAIVDCREKESGAGAADAHEAFPEIRIEQVFLQLFEEKGVSADLELAVHAGQFFRVLTTEYIRLYEGVPELLQALREAGGKVYLLSNAQRIFTEYELHVLGIAKYFDDIFISSECAVKKPDERFFHMLLDKHNIDLAQSVMIGNDLRCDIGGAKKVGLDTLYIHSNISPELKEEPVADYVLMEMDIAKVQKILLK